MKIFEAYRLLFISAVGFLVFDTASCSDVAEDLSHHKNIELLKEPCGFLEHDRTLNTTGLFEFRWLALIAYEGKKEGRFRCQGVLINDRYVLTPAHCLPPAFSRFKPVSVRLGEYDLKSDEDCQDSLPDEPKGIRCAPAPLDIDIEEILVHPSYSNQQPHSVVHDIGLLRLASPVVSAHVKPICLPIEEQPKTLEKLNLFGWSRKNKELSIPVKQQVSVIGYDRCVAAVKNKVVISDENNICVSRPTEGDPFCLLSGSSLNYYTENDNGQGRYVMAAIGSIGHTSCATNVIPEVFTRVGVHMKWILDSMKP